MPSTILVTGATGTIGRQVALALARDGAAVRAGVRDPAKAADLAAAGVELVALDLSAPSSVAAALSGVERLFLLTPFVEHPMPLVEVALAAARDAGVRHVVRMSVAGADPPSSSAPPPHHGRIEEAVAHGGMGWTILQPTFFMDNFVNYGAAQTIAAEGRFYGASGEGKTSYVSSVDVGAVAATILQEPGAHAGKTYLVTGGEAVSDAEVAAIIEQLRGKPVTYVDLTPEQQRAALEQQGAPAWMIDAFVGLEGIKRAGWAAGVSPVVQEVTGRPPETLRAFVQRHVAAFG
jgi:uncharacterized protein YbjT (DUF2867 family)